MISRWIRFACAALAVGSLVSCSSNASDDLTGSWAGSDNRSDGSVFTSVVTLNQNGSTITGTVTTSNGGTPVYVGTLTGTYFTPSLTFAITVPIGGVTSAPGCTLSISGNATFTGAQSGTTTPTKTLAGTYSGVGGGTCSTTTISDVFVWTSTGS